jgi:hypothetical protein
MPYINIDVDITEFDTDDLIKEICKRGSNIDKADKEKIGIALGFTKSGMLHGESLDIVLKKEVFEEAISKYTLPELQKRLA